jgi:hypothetical protein
MESRPKKNIVIRMDGVHTIPQNVSVESMTTMLMRNLVERNQKRNSDGAASTIEVCRKN